MEQHCGKVSGVDEGVCGWWVKEGEGYLMSCCVCSRIFCLTDRDAVAGECVNKGRVAKKRETDRRGKYVGRTYRRIYKWIMC